jgi:hypothetical protein
MWYTAGMTKIQVSEVLERVRAWPEARQMVAHESARTTKLYDRRSDKVTLHEVERIVL